MYSTAYSMFFKVFKFFFSFLNIFLKSVNHTFKVHRVVHLSGQSGEEIREHHDIPVFHMLESEQWSNWLQRTLICQKASVTDLRGW